MKKIFLIISIFTFFTAQNLSAKVIRLNDFIHAYLKHSEKLKQDFQDVKKAEAGKLKAKAVNDIKLGANGGYTYQKGSDTTSLVPTDNSKIFGGGVSADKLISNWGTRLSLSHSLNHIDSKFGTSMYTSAIPALATYSGKEMQLYSSSFSLSLIQPLLKNMFGFLDRMPGKIAGLQEKIQQIYYTEGVEKRMIEAITLYFNWLYLTQQQDILKDIITNNNSVLRQTRQKVRAGIAQIADLEVARGNVMVYEKSLIDIERDIVRVQNEMGRYLKLEKTDKPDDTLLEKSPQLPQIAIQNNLRSIQMLDLTLKQLSLVLSQRKNETMPDLSLVATYSLSGAKDSLSGAYSNLTTSEWYAGFQFSLPLFNSGAKGAVKESRAEYQKFLLRRTDTIKQLTIAQKNLKNSLKHQEKMLDKQKEYIRSLLKKRRDEKRQYRQGILSLRETVRTINELSNARLQQTGYVIQFHNLYYQYLELVDQIALQYQSCIPEECNLKQGNLKVK